MTRQEAKNFIESLINLRAAASDAQASKAPALYPVWKSDTFYASNDKVLYNNILYKVITEHTSQANWTPDTAPSLFAKILIPDENVIPEWEQPDSTNPYSLGDKVTYKGIIYVSTIEDNVWAPDIYGWEEVI